MQFLYHQKSRKFWTDLEQEHDAHTCPLQEDVKLLFGSDIGGGGEDLMSEKVLGQKS